MKVCDVRRDRQSCISSFCQGIVPDALDAGTFNRFVIVTGLGYLKREAHRGGGVKRIGVSFCSIEP